MTSGNLFQIFNNSFSRATTSEVNGRGFADTFLTVLTSSSDRIKSRFIDGGEARMSGALLQSIMHLAAYYRTCEASDALFGIAQRQSRVNRDIEPAMYDTFLGCLLMVVERFDPKFTPEVADAWKKILTPGLDYMKAMYDS